jgi:hypothetical protein
MRAYVHCWILNYGLIQSGTLSPKQKQHKQISETKENNL